MALIADTVTAGHPAAPAPAVRAVSLTVPAGRIIGLSGPSGSGKTTLARALAGLLPTIGGTITVDGQPITTRRGRMNGQVGMLFQSPRRATNPGMRLDQIIAEPLAGHRGCRRRSPADAPTPADLARTVGLTADLLDRYPGEVSDGQLQRACLARALAADPVYLICDEATVMLDAATTASIAAVLTARAAAGMGILAISHDRALLAAWAHEEHDLRDLTDGPKAASGAC